MTIKLAKLPPSGAKLLLEGRLDTVSAPAAQETLLNIAAEYENLVLDLTGLSYISSAGLRVLLVLQKQVSKTGREMSLTGVRPAIMEVFEMTGFVSILNII